MEVAAVPLTHRRILTIAFPIVLANATVPLLGAMDTAVIGHLGQAAPIGAVGLGATILSTLYWAFGFLRMSTSGLAAQSKGADDAVELSATLIRALGIAFAAGVTLIVLHTWLFALAFRIAPASHEVESMAMTFLSIRIWAAPATIGLYALTGYLVGTERTRAILVLQLWQNGLNMGLDLWFVMGLGWGVGGVAFASVIAEVTGLALGLYLAREALAPLRAALKRLADPEALRRTFSASRDILIRTVILQLSFTTFVFLGARFGDTTLAANAILLQFLSIMAFALDGFAFAAETLVGQAMGARDPGALRRASRMAMQWGYGGAVALALLFALGGYLAIHIMTNAPDVQAEALSLLPWLVAAPLIGAACWIYDGIFIGALMTHPMRNAALQVAVLYAAALAILVPSFGNQGLWAALMVMNAARGLTLRRAFPQVLNKAAI
ncbi:MAG: MATE family efflux transporter [Cypionkella sp.]